MVPKGVIDRFEGDVAVVELESGGIFNVPKKDLPPGAGEGSVIEICKGKIVVLEEETRNRRRQVQKMVEEVFED